MSTKYLGVGEVITSLPYGQNSVEIRMIAPPGGDTYLISHLGYREAVIVNCTVYLQKTEQFARAARTNEQVMLWQQDQLIIWTFKLDYYSILEAKPLYRLAVGYITNIDQPEEPTEWHTSFIHPDPQNNPDVSVYWDWGVKRVTDWVWRHIPKNSGVYGKWQIWHYETETWEDVEAWNTPFTKVFLPKG